MAKERATWVELTVELRDGVVQVRPRGSDGDETTPRELSWSKDKLALFAERVKESAEAHEPLDTPTRGLAQELY
ncbi:MAG TPA: hypothetical protein PK156_49320, partial [Polyangium sp.]|nr:hypothetical protein [Polyangium sp.]